MDIAVEPVTIASVVEGHGEVGALPVLLRRMAAVIAPESFLHLPRPHRIPKSKLVKAGALESAIGAQANHVMGKGGILVLIDADDDCPAQVGPALLARAMKARSDKAIAVVLAKREFEAWFLAGAPSLAGSRRLPHDLAAPDNPEGIRGAKEWLTRQMTSSRPYRETVDQEALTSQLDLDMARRKSPSFAKLWRDVERLFAADREQDHYEH